MQNPPTETWSQYLLALVERHADLTEPIVFALGFAESVVVLSAFVPSTVMFLAIGTGHAAIGGVFWPVWLAGSAGAFVGDIVSFFAGRKLKKKVGKVWPLNKNPRWVAYARRFVSRYGMSGIIAGKFLVMARPFIPVIAGSMRMSWPKFLIASALSSLIWAGVFLAPGYGILWFFNR